MSATAASPPTTGGPIDPIQATTTHPVARPLLTMRWELLSYVHWALDPATVQAVLPPGLTVDTFEGRAYVGLVPFRMGGIRVHPPGRSTSAVPLPQGTSPETNVRTYVVGPDGGRGVHFDSLDVTRLAPTLVAQGGYRLPYAWSRMALGVRGDRRAYRSARRWPAPRGAASHLEVAVGPRLADDEVTALDRFLTARWSLYAVTGRGTVLRAHVDHEPWPLHAAEVVHLRDELVAAAGYGPLTSRSPDHVRAAEAVTVRVGAPRVVG